MTTAQPAYIYEDYAEKEGRWELIRGKFFDMSPAPTNKHQWLVGNFHWLFKKLLEECPECQVFISPIDWKISSNTVVQPDVAIFCNKDEFFADHFTKPPELIVEVLSKSTALKDKNIKYKLYEEQGVKYFIIAEPDYEVADIFELNNGKYEKVKTVSKDEEFEFEIKDCTFTARFERVFSFE
jgi:Uma2 family endonuclease